MNQEVKICQNCKKEFTIEPEDFNFYEKMKVPSPTWCPECRMIRRLMFRNERALYKRKCDLCNKSMISMHSSESSFPVYCHDCWWSDKWKLEENLNKYDWNKQFFLQWKELFNKTPQLDLWYIGNNVNSEFINYSGYDKNCHLAYSVIWSEDVAYSYSVDRSKDIIDSTYLKNSEKCYENIDSNNNYNCKFVIQSKNCLDSSFLFDCSNCQNCFLSANLKNKKFYIKNKPYLKEKYFEKIKELDFNSYESLKELLKEFSGIKNKAIHRFANIIKSENCLGENIENCKNTKITFGAYDCENSKYGFRLSADKDLMDGVGVLNAELAYELIAPGFGNSRIKFVFLGDASQNIEYSSNCHNCNDLFGCIGLRNKEYCILNKQYTKEEYEKLVSKIIQHMNDMPYVDKKGRVYKYGEFFPTELSPFTYNETIAQEYFPITKEQALAQGYAWKDPAAPIKSGRASPNEIRREERNISIDIHTEDLPDHIKDVKDDIIGKVIQCANTQSTEIGSPEINKEFSQCTSAFKIIPQELEFYRKMNLPLPRLCSNCRHYQRLKQRNPLKLWHRQCMCQGSGSSRSKTSGGYTNTIEHFHKDKPCPNEFETSYAPDRPEIVYCEECYKREVQ